MDSSNKKIGNNFEVVVSKALAKNGFWVHRLTANAAGQPADMIAVREGKAYLIDAKYCSTEQGFRLSRIEANQEYSMTLWKDRGNGDGWFAVGIDEEIYMFPFNYLSVARKYHSTISPDEIRKDGMALEKWIKKKCR